jgi:hypothetical protein
MQFFSRETIRYFDRIIYQKVNIVSNDTNIRSRLCFNGARVILKDTIAINSHRINGRRTVKNE